MHLFLSDFLAFQIHSLPSILSTFMIFNSNTLKRNVTTVGIPTEGQHGHLVLCVMVSS